MKKAITIIAMVVILAMVIPSISFGGNKYDKIITNPKFSDMYNTYKEAMDHPIFKEYVGLVIETPGGMYNRLEEAECNQELLNFYKNNTRFAYDLVGAIVILSLAQTAWSGDGELVMVSAFIRSEQGMRIGNAYQMQMEAMIMREMPAYQVYEKFYDPEHLKYVVEGIFNLMEENSK